MRRLITGLAVTGLAAVAAPAARADVTTEYFKMPSGATRAGTGLAVAADGTVFFGADNAFAPNPPIVRLAAGQAVAGSADGMTTIPTPVNGGLGIMRDLSYSERDQALYWTRSDNVVGKVVAGVASIGTVPVAPWGIVANPDGGAWLTEYAGGVGTPNPFDRTGSRIARVSADLGLSELPSLQTYTGTYYSIRYDAKPRGITLAPDGTPWFTEADNGNPGWRVARVAGASYEEYDAPCVPEPRSYCSGSSGSGGLTDVAVDQTGAVWYTNELNKVITRLVPGDKQVEYPMAGLGLPGGVPRAISAAPDGSLWVAVSGGFAAPTSNAILRVVPATLGTTIYRLGAANAPYAVAPDLAHGNVWFTGSEGAGGTSFGRLSGADGVTVTPPPGDGGGAPPVTQPTVTPPATTTLKPGVTTAATVSKPTVKGDSISANQICVGPPQDKCSLVYLVQTHEYVTGFPGSKGLMSAAAKKLTTVGQLKVTLKGGQSKKVTIKLNAKGKKLRKKMSFKATLLVTQSINGAKPKQILKKNVKFKR